MRVAILGSEGFVGKNLVELLDPHFDLVTSDIFDNNPRSNYVKMDIQNLEQVSNVLEGCDAVINLVTNTLVSSFDQVIENAKVNIIGLLNVLEASRKNNLKKIIFTSASSLVGQTLENPVSERHPTTPKTPYGITKLASEHYLRLYKELYDLDYVIFRFFNIFGPHQINGVIPNMISKINNNEPVTVFGKGNQIRDFVFIKDVASFFEKSLVSNIADNQIINMGSGKGATVMDVINLISEKLNKTPSINFQPERPGEISNFVADTTLLKSLFGKTPTSSLEDGLQQTIDWNKSQNN